MWPPRPGRPEGRQGRPLDAESAGVVRGPVRLRARRRGGGGAEHPLQGPRAAVHPAPVGRDHAGVRGSRRTGGLPRDPRRGAARSGRLRAGRAGRPGVPDAPSRDRARRRPVPRLRPLARRAGDRRRPRRCRRARHRPPRGHAGRPVHHPLHLRHHVVPEGRDHQPPQLPAPRLVVRRGPAPDRRGPGAPRPAAVRHLGRPVHPPRHLHPRGRPRADGDVRGGGGPSPDGGRAHHGVERGGRDGGADARASRPGAARPLAAAHRRLRGHRGRGAGPLRGGGGAARPTPGLPALRHDRGQRDGAGARPRRAGRGPRRSPASGRPTASRRASSIPRPAGISPSTARASCGCAGGW